MKPRLPLCSLLALLLLATTASAQVDVRDHRDDAAVSDFDGTGWTLLGERVVRKKDRDTIQVGAYEGRFDQITLVVSGGALSMKKLTVFFGNKKKFSPKVKHVFREGARSRAIDLPKNDRVISKVELKYKSLARGSRVTVRVYGRDTRAGQDPVATYTPPSFDAKGWELLGERQVDGKGDRDVLEVGRDDGRFTKVNFVVYDSDVVFDEVTITFGNGETMTSTTRMAFQEGSRTGAIDLSGEKRFIKKIEFRYSNLPGGGKARVAVYGMPAKADKVKVRDHRGKN